jgi:signal transduction histidine kinase
MKPAHQSSHAVQIGVIAFYVLVVSYIWRSLTSSYQQQPDFFAWYVGLELIFILLFAFVMWRGRLPLGLIHVYFAIQCLIAYYLISIPPHLDYLTGFFVLLSYQAALKLSGRRLWVWCGIFISLTMISLIAVFGFVKGLALAFVPIAGCIIFPFYVLANHEEEQANIKSEALVKELEEKNIQLRSYAAQVEQIASIEERNRLARELHDSVSQTMFSIMLNTRAAQIYLERQTNELRSQLEVLQRLTQEALSEMRSLISQLRQQDE